MYQSLNVRAKTIELSEEHASINFHDTGLGKAFLDMTPKAKQQKKKQVSWTSTE